MDNRSQEGKSRGARWKARAAIQARNNCDLDKVGRGGDGGEEGGFNTEGTGLGTGQVRGALEEAMKDGT